jgi:hypothetical protein
VVTEDYFIPSRAMSVYKMYDVLVMHWHHRSTRISFRPLRAIYILWSTMDGKYRVKNSPVHEYCYKAPDRYLRASAPRTGRIGTRFPAHGS